MSTIKNLQEAIEAQNETEIINVLKNLLESKEIQLENNKIVKDILALRNEKINQIVVELIAEWSKNELNRNLLTDDIIIEDLLKLLESTKSDIVLGSIRALCNICYENEKARKIIGQNGLNMILFLLNSDDKRESNVITTKASGFLVNLLNNNDDLQKLALKNNILTVLEKLLSKYLKCYDENITLYTFLLATMNSVIDYIDDQNIPFNESLCNIIIDIFKKSDTPEISVMCLEILHSQSDKDDIKSIMAKRGTCELVIDLIHKYKDQVNDEESRSIMKMACDLIVIILTGDDCMNLLYNNGNGKVYESMVSWLESDDPDLLSTGVLAIGNFARKDLNCIQMVNNGLSKKLIDLLSKYNKKQSDIKVQHALLSTLKNLVIPQQNKAKILNEGLIDVIYPMIEIDQFLVVFKLLGTFRMVIDGQEKAALDLLSRKDFIEKLIYWCYNSDHLGVRGEVPRLLAWLIKNCHSFKPFKTLISIKNTVKCLVEMVSSNHAVMQNESFYALNLLYLGLSKQTNKKEITNDDENDENVLCQQLIEAEIGKNLSFVCFKYGDKMDKHTINNLLTLLEQLINSNIIVEHLKMSKLDDALTKLTLNPNAQENSEKVKNILAKF